MGWAVRLGFDERQHLLQLGVRVVPVHHEAGRQHHEPARSRPRTRAFSDLTSKQPHTAIDSGHVHIHAASAHSQLPAQTQASESGSQRQGLRAWEEVG